MRYQRCYLIGGVRLPFPPPLPKAIKDFEDYYHRSEKQQVPTACPVQKGGYGDTTPVPRKRPTHQDRTRLADFSKNRQRTNARRAINATRVGARKPGTETSTLRTANAHNWYSQTLRIEARTALSEPKNMPQV